MMRAGFLNGRGGGAPGIEIEFLKPVRPGDTLTMLARVTETKISRSRPDRGFVSFQSRVTNQSEEDVMTLSFKEMIRTRPKTS
jgi:acyl dehydratase